MSELTSLGQQLPERLLMSLSVHVALIQQAGTLPYKGGGGRQNEQNERKRKITRKGVGKLH